MGCGPETTEDKLSCSRLSAFEEIGSVVVQLSNNITVIKDGQNICTIKYKKSIPGKKVLDLFQCVNY